MSEMERHGEACVVLDGEGDGAVCTARVFGEIDLTNAPAVTRRVLRAAEGASRLVLDLTAVSFLDSHALRHLAAIRRATLSAGRQISIISGSGTPSEHLLVLTGLDLALGTDPGAGADREQMTDSESGRLRRELSEENAVRSRPVAPQPHPEPQRRRTDDR